MVTKIGLPLPLLRRRQWQLGRLVVVVVLRVHIYSDEDDVPAAVVPLSETELSGAFSGAAAWEHLQTFAAEPHMYNNPNPEELAEKRKGRRKSDINVWDRV
ncbi:hypothetical protein DFJ73DRAFT_766178 [Zopfochytrium polystomum]|nr:hypothetical protein DFJ73DRAFT_766178 [Zopfochytrium polystomum]